MAVIQPSTCSCFIQIWVNTDALLNRKSTGVYLVDNMLEQGSLNEGSADLLSSVAVGACICWTLLNIDPSSEVELRIRSVGRAGIFGTGGTPRMVNATTWTGQAEASGTDRYAISISAIRPGSPPVMTRVSPSLQGC